MCYGVTGMYESCIKMRRSSMHTKYVEFSCGKTHSQRLE